VLRAEYGINDGALPLFFCWPPLKLLVPSAGDGSIEVRLATCDLRAAPQRLHKALPATQTKAQANHQPKKTVPGKALAEARKKMGCPL
jgi:hypothetical protein